MNVIILAHCPTDAGALRIITNLRSDAERTARGQTSHWYHVVIDAQQLPPYVVFTPRGQWRIMRTDQWQHNPRVIDALRIIAARPDVELIDPTGLLGSSRYGTDGNRPTSRPVLAGTELRTIAPRPKGKP